MNDIYSFQLCPKLVILSQDRQEVLLACRAGEADLDDFFTFIGGKLEITDRTLIEGLRREKIQEIGQASIMVAPSLSCYCLLFTKADGSQMFLPYFPALYNGGDIILNPREYSTYKWVPLNRLEGFQPKAPGVYEAVIAAKKCLEIVDVNELVRL